MNTANIAAVIRLHKTERQTYEYLLKILPQEVLIAVHCCDQLACDEERCSELEDLAAWVEKLG